MCAGICSGTLSGKGEVNARQEKDEGHKTLKKKTSDPDCKAFARTSVASSNVRWDIVLLAHQEQVWCVPWNMFGHSCELTQVF